MGVVYAAEHIKLGTRVAVKVLKRSLHRSQPAHEKRFLREARAAAAIHDPNIVRITDFGESDGIVYFVMEYIEGRDLGSLLANGARLPWPRARSIILQVISALGSAHRHQIVHRDVKPSNCIVFEDERRDPPEVVKVLDFGIAKVSVECGEAAETLTRTDELFGTVAYMAPELIEGTAASPASDIYALGVMLFRMLAGALPFAGPTPLKVLTLHATQEPPRPRTIEPSIPAHVEAVILRCLAKRPAQRFATMEEVAAALTQGPPAGMRAPGDATIPAGPQPSLGPPEPAVETPIARTEALRSPAAPLEARAVATTTTETEPSPSSSLWATRTRWGRAVWVSTAGLVIVGLVVLIVRMSIEHPPALANAAQEQRGPDPGALPPIPASAAAMIPASPAAEQPTPEPTPQPAPQPAPQPSGPEPAPVETPSSSTIDSEQEATGPARATSPAPPAPEPLQAERTKKPRASGGHNKGRSRISRIRSKVRQQCGRGIPNGTMLSISIPVGADGHPITSKITGGSAELQRCASDIVRQQHFPSSENGLVSFEIRM